MSAPKTQRLRADYYSDGTLSAVYTFMHASTPVLVVPEAAVKGCRHSYPDGIDHCKDCGAFREWDDNADRWGRWQRPHVLRVGRSR